MHETILASKIVEKAKEHGKVKSIFVEVGQLSDVPVDELEEALKKMVDWKITVKEKKARVKCSCGYEGEPKIVEKRHSFTLFVCPKCSSLPKVLEGRDIILREVEVE